jgi:hypothetical protein
MVNYPLVTIALLKFILFEFILIIAGMSVKNLYIKYALYSLALLYLIEVIVFIWAMTRGNKNNNNNNNNKNNNTKENYVFNREYTGPMPASPDFYKLYSSPENDTSYPRDRCQFCKKYTSEEFQPCPHNCRQYGVSLCDQGKIM